MAQNRILVDFLWSTRSCLEQEQAEKGERDETRGVGGLFLREGSWFFQYCAFGCLWDGCCRSLKREWLVVLSHQSSDVWCFYEV